MTHKNIYWKKGHQMKLKKECDTNLFRKNIIPCKLSENFDKTT
jgi:hypothetical protein